MTDDRHTHVPDDGPPPFLGSWRNLYAGVILILALVVFAVWLFSRHFS